MDDSKSFLNTPVAILTGCLIIALSILVSGGVIKINPKLTGVQAVAPSASPDAQPTAPQRPTVTLDQIKDAFNKSIVKFGDSNSKLVVIEVADPSCPYCQVAAGKNPELNKQVGSQFTLVSDGGSYIAPVPEIKKLIDNGKAAFAWIYTSGHGSGEMGTKAMYCAFEKGKFWEAHDLLMTSKGYDLLNSTVKNDKSKAGDMADFLAPVVDSGFIKQCLESGKYDSRIKDDSALAAGIGISGTPGFYFNTTNFSGAYSFADMESAVKKALGL